MFCINMPRKTRASAARSAAAKQRSAAAKQQPAAPRVQQPAAPRQKRVHWAPRPCPPLPLEVWETIADRCYETDSRALSCTCRLLRHVAKRAYEVTFSVDVPLTTAERVERVVPMGVSVCTFVVRLNLFGRTPDGPAGIELYATEHSLVSLDVFDCAGEPAGTFQTNIHLLDREHNAASLTLMPLQHFIDNRAILRVRVLRSKRSPTAAADIREALRRQRTKVFARALEKLAQQGPVI